MVHETLEAHQIGWAPDDWSQLAGFLSRNGVLAEDAVKAGLVFDKPVGDSQRVARIDRELTQRIAIG